MLNYIMYTSVRRFNNKAQTQLLTFYITDIKTNSHYSGMQALHRLILSGTPIQNNVLELWGLFDWLMPGEYFSMNT